MTSIRARYAVRCPAAEADAVARYIAYEQTVELPESMPLPKEVLEGVVGRVESVEPDAASKDAFVVTMAYNLRLAAGQLPQLLNLLYGNVSIRRGIRLVDVEFPDEFLKGLRGPNRGIEGLRELLGVRRRPLLATAIKPMGAGLKAYAAVARDFALGGGDIVKDDQNLSDEDLAGFCERVARCHEAVEEANAKTGAHAIYLPIVTAPHGEVEERLGFVLKNGLKGALLCPLLAGLDYTRWLAERYRMVLMAHPSFSGTFYADAGHGIEPGLWLGTVMRLLGADASIFPNAGGRFAPTREGCRAVAARLRSPLGGLKPAWPAPAGGMRLENLKAMAEDFGPDSIFLIGGGLLGHPGGVEAGARAFLGEIRRLFP